MSEIGHTISSPGNVQARYDSDVESLPIVKKQKTSMEAGRNTWMQSSAKAQVPPFTSQSNFDGTSLSTSKGALGVMNDNVTIDFAAIIALVYQLSSEERRSAAESVQIDIQQVADQMKQSASDIRTGATLALAGGIVSSGMNIAGGVVGIAGGVKSFSMLSAAPEEAAPVAPEEAESGSTVGSGSEAASAPEGGAPEAAESNTSQESMQDTADEMSAEISEAETHQSQLGETSEQPEEITDMNKNMKDMAGSSRMQAQAARANSVSQIAQGISSGLQGAGQAAGSAGKFGSDIYQAKSKEDDAETQKKQASLEREKEYGKSMGDDVKKMYDIASQMEQEQHSTRLKIMDTL